MNVKQLVGRSWKSQLLIGCFPTSKVLTGAVNASWILLTLETFMIKSHFSNHTDYTLSPVTEGANWG